MIDVDCLGVDVDDEQAGARQAVENEHNFIEADRLAGVDLGTAGGVVAPNDLLAGRDLCDVIHAGEEDVAVREHPDVVVLPAAAGGVGPLGLAVVDEVHLVVALADVEYGTLRGAFVGQAGGGGIFGDEWSDG